MPTIALRPSARALTARHRRHPPLYRRPIISAGYWPAGYVVNYRPMASEYEFSPSWCCLLVVPSNEEDE
jgi:hypothetical protein